MLVVIVGKVASGKTTLLQEFVGGSGGVPLITVDNCTMDLFIKLFVKLNDITKNHNIIIATDNDRLTGFADIVIYAKGAQTSGVYNKTMFDKNGKFLLESDNQTIASDVINHYLLH